MLENEVPYKTELGHANLFFILLLALITVSSGGLAYYFYDINTALEQRLTNQRRINTEESDHARHLDERLASSEQQLSQTKEKLSAQSQHHSDSIAQLEEEKSRLKDQVSEASIQHTDQLKSNGNTIAKLKEKNAFLQKRLEQETSAAQQALQNKQQEFSHLQDEKEQLAAQLAEHAVKIDKLTIEKEALTAQIEPLKAKLDQSLVIEQGLLEKQQELPILREEKEQLTAQLTEHAVKIEELTIEKGALTAQIEPLKVQIAELNADREALDQLEHRLEQEQVLIHQLNNKAENLESTNQTIKRQMGRMVNTLQSELESKHLTIKSYRQQLKITLLNSLLYPSSSSRLSIQGKTALQKLAPLLKESAPHAIHVAGHTDNRPFRSNAISPYNNNWDLSSARASEVVRFLISQGVNNSRFTTLGYADTNPKGDNNTEEGRAQNRRIELFIKGRSEG